MARTRTAHASKKKGYDDNKAMVFGALETGGKLKAKVLTDVTG